MKNNLRHLAASYKRLRRHVGWLNAAMPTGLVAAKAKSHAFSQMNITRKALSDEIIRVRAELDNRRAS